MSDRMQCAEYLAKVRQQVEWQRAPFGPGRSFAEQREQWDLLRRRVARPAQPQRAPVRQMIEAYEAATGTCVCCD
jgi:hypothetical protein